VTSPKHLTIRNVPPRLAKALRVAQQRGGTSLNETVLELLARSLGTGPETNGLEALAGTWSSRDLKEFEATQAAFERTDDELWK
jgi:plasmid stability protein